jgi:putative DNA primase/helicase
MHPLSEFDSDINIINMENGLYNLKDGKLEPHNPKYFSFIQVPVKYDPKAKCPAIQTVVTRVLKPEDVTKFYELLGYLMYRSYEVQKAFIFYGPGQSGKSMMLQIARTFVGDSNCSNVTFQQMAEDKFAVAELHNKLLNEAGDLDSTAIKTTGTFKMLTGGSRDMMRVQRKFGQPFDMSNFAKIVFATNILSAVHDDTTGFSRRVEIFICDNKFTLNPEDEQLLKDFQEPEEYSGLFNLVLPYLKHLLKTKRYTNETSAEDMYILYAAASNPTKAFLEFMVVESPESVITKNLLYDKYAKFCIKSHGRPVHFSQFGKRLIETYKDTIHTGQIRTGPGGKTRVYTWVGIRVREDGEELENDDKGILGIPST